MSTFIDYRVPGPYAGPLVVDGRVYWIARSRRGILRGLFTTENEALSAAEADNEKLAELETIQDLNDRAILHFELNGQSVLVASNPGTGRLARTGSSEKPIAHTDIGLESPRTP